ncbi:MAG: hypothetical protein OXU45_09285 [Candidatus Melainabacteria bacterium]|nr:hypothetical protein [Candidatus Melainabacteria bacterium]
MNRLDRLKIDDRRQVIIVDDKQEQRDYLNAQLQDLGVKAANITELEDIDQLAGIAELAAADHPITIICDSYTEKGHRDMIRELLVKMAAADPAQIDVLQPRFGFRSTAVRKIAEGPGGLYVAHNEKFGWPSFPALDLEEITSLSELCQEFDLSTMADFFDQVIRDGYRRKLVLMTKVGRNDEQVRVATVSQENLDGDRGVLKALCAV